MDVPGQSTGPPHAGERVPKKYVEKVTQLQLKSPEAVIRNGKHPNAD